MDPAAEQERPRDLDTNGAEAEQAGVCEEGLEGFGVYPVAGDPAMGRVGVARELSGLDGRAFSFTYGRRPGR